MTAIKGLAPDLGIHAGAGLLRRPLIDCFGLGILNAHMGLLPAFRGVNVAEWAALEKAPVGCTVHLIDSGIDTGPILARREVDSTGCHSIASLRSAVDDTQLALLGTVVGLIIDGNVPETLTASEPPGRQYFYMHDNRLAILAARLSKNPPAMLQRGETGENRRILAGSVTHADH